MFGMMFAWLKSHPYLAAALFALVVFLIWHGVASWQHHEAHEHAQTQAPAMATITTPSGTQFTTPVTVTTTAAPKTA
jgi:hypothetical protein